MAVVVGWSRTATPSSTVALPMVQTQASSSPVVDLVCRSIERATRPPKSPLNLQRSSVSRSCALFPFLLLREVWTNWELDGDLGCQCFKFSINSSLLPSLPLFSSGTDQATLRNPLSAFIGEVCFPLLECFSVGIYRWQLMNWQTMKSWRNICVSLARIEFFISGTIVRGWNCRAIWTESLCSIVMWNLMFDVKSIRN